MKTLLYVLIGIDSKPTLEEYMSSEGLTLYAKNERLGGEGRIAVDGVLTGYQCQELLELVKVMLWFLGSDKFGY